MFQIVSDLRLNVQHQSSLLPTFPKNKNDLTDLIIKHVLCQAFRPLSHLCQKEKDLTDLMIKHVLCLAFCKTIAANLM